MSHTREAAQERLALHAKFTALPELFSRLMSMFDDPEMTASQVAEVINKDAGLVTRLLRIANSAYYGGSGNVATVTQAIVKLGFRTTKAVVMSSTVYTSISKSAPADVDLRPFWHHAIEVAVAAMLIAEEVCPRMSEEAFVAGLLHDLGRAAFASAFPDLFREAVTEGAAAFEREAETARFGIDHAEAGGYLTRHWNFPDALVRGIADHHLLPDLLPDAHRERIAIAVGLADTMAHASWSGPAALRQECRQRREHLISLAGLSEERLGKIGAQVQPQVREWAALLEIDLGDPLALLEDANRRLFDAYRVMEELNAETERLQARLLAEEMERSKLEALRVICATFSHHINNATTTILGRAQLVTLALGRRDPDEMTGKIAQSMKVIENAVDTISSVLAELKCLTRFETVSYHGKSEILDLERARKAESNTESPATARRLGEG